MPQNNIILEMKNISKNFPGVRALDDVSLDVKQGEILGLLGENGAGKSTLIKILSGAYSLEEGEIIIDGESKIFTYPNQALEAGIRVIYQELTSYEPLTVAENIFAGESIKNKAGFISWRKMGRESKAILSTLGSNIKPFALMENLTVAGKQIVEIAKAIHGNVKILVMDEPTSALDEKDVENLYEVITRLKEKGVAIVYISHRMEEILRITDRVAVLRDGKKVGDKNTSETSNSELVSMIVGKKLSEQYPKRNIEKGKVIFEGKNISYLKKVKNVSFFLREGEIVAFFGLLGAGCYPLFSVLFGDRIATSGDIFIENKKIIINHPFKAKANGVGFIPLDRKEEGLALVMDIKQNITAANIEKLGKSFVLDKKIELNHSKKWFNMLGIKAPGISTVIKSLSGGNQQKVIVARWLEKESKILLMNEPTRGIDVGSKAEIYKITEDLCAQGVGVLMVSSELPEIMAISDRVYVMRNGTIAGEFKTKETSQEELMHIAQVKIKKGKIMDDSAIKTKRNFKLTDTLILIGVLIVLFVFFTLMNKQFIAYDNISTMLKNMVLAGILALGLTPLMIARGLDISFGSSISMVSVTIAVLYTVGGVNLWLSLIIGVIIATIIGFINGVLIEFFNLIPIILTLGMLAILQAFALVIAYSFTTTYSILMLTDELYFFATKAFLGIPYPVMVLVVLVLVYWFILSKTKLGRTIYLIGANPVLARLSGIKVRRVKILLYTFMGTATGLASVMIVALTGVGMAYHGQRLPLPTLSAVLLGGISLLGGSGSVWGTLIGLLIVTVIFNGLSVLNVQSYFIQLFQGLALIIIVATYEIRNKRATLN